MPYSAKTSKKQRFYWAKTKQNQQCQIKEKQSNFLLINLYQKVFAKVFWSEKFFSIFCFFFFPQALATPKKKYLCRKKIENFPARYYTWAWMSPPSLAIKKISNKNEFLKSSRKFIPPANSKTLSKYHSVNRGRSISWDKDLFAYGRDQTLCLN